MHCSACGQDLSDDTICLFRSWPGRVETLQKAMPGHPIHMCPTAEIVVNSTER